MRNETFCKMTNQLVFDMTIAQRNIHVVHWNLQAESFIFLHDYLGELYTTLVQYLDETAEQLRFKQEYASAKLSTCLKKTLIQEIETRSPISHQEAIEIVSANIRYLKALTNDIITYADTHELWDSVDVFTAHTVYYSKVLYFLESSKPESMSYKR